MLTQIDVIYGVDYDAAPWSSALTYSVGEQVSSGGLFYESIQAGTNKPPATEPGYWRNAEKALALPILGVSPKESLLIRKVTGLNPPDRNLFIGDYASDGGAYQGSRVADRPVTMIIDLNPNYALGETVPGLRDILYKTFMDPHVSSDAVELVLHDDDGNLRNLYGYTEKLETDLFDIETMAQVSMVCPDPFVRDVMETVFYNASATWTTVPFIYGGTAETGFEVEIHVSNTHGKLTLKNNNKKMILTDSFVTGDAVYFNTIRGARDIRKATIAQANAVRAANPSWTISQVWTELIRLGQAIPMIAKLDAASPWLELHSQSNTLSVYGTATTDNMFGTKFLVYRGSYWGV